MKGFDTETSVRLGKKAKELLARVCEARGQKISSFLRRAALKELASLGYLSQEERKALGVES